MAATILPTILNIVDLSPEFLWTSQFHIFLNVIKYKVLGVEKNVWIQ